jgi:UDP-glucuronate 4-epimerase
MSVLVTGVAGFIGYHLAEALLAAGCPVVGIDNLNDYYDVALKRARLERLQARRDFAFHCIDVADPAALDAVISGAPGLESVVHLAAQAGVRYSLTAPMTYVHSNMAGHVAVLEACRRIEGLRHIVYASSSSVYGRNVKQPFAVGDRTDSPVSLYGASKKTQEVIAEAYASIYHLPLTGLRFFTVYGPWGRPDMALFMFTQGILAGTPIPVFNRGKMRRDFTYVDDIVTGIIAAIDRPPSTAKGVPSHQIYNLGNHRSVALLDFIAVLEKALDRPAVLDLLPMQAGDVTATYADIETSRRDLGFEPTTPIEDGIPRFVAWYRDYYGVQ